MIKNVLRLSTGLMLLVLGVVDVVLVVGVLLGQREIRLAQSAYGQPVAGQTARFAGADANGRPVDIPASGPGAIVWFGSEQCPYCKTDHEMPRLVVTLQKKGWQTIVLLPSYDQQFAPSELNLSNVQMVPFVAGEWLNQFPLVVTPTLLMFDGNQRLIWYHRGQLTPADSLEALGAAGIRSTDRDGVTK